MKSNSRISRTTRAKLPQLETSDNKQTLTEEERKGRA